MSPEDRHALTSSIANLWTFQTSFMVQVTLALQNEGALSSAAVERMLQRLDRDTDILDGEDDKAHAQGALATVRKLLGEWRDDQGQRPGER